MESDKTEGAPPAERPEPRRPSADRVAQRPIEPDPATPADIDGPRLEQKRLALRLGRNEAGTPADRYTVVGLLGAGGTGQVYSLYDRDLQRSTALKVLIAGAGADATQVDGFFDEARLTASLQHPNVLPVFDVDVTRDGAPCFSMGRVDGRTMADAIETSSPTARDAKLATANAVVTILIAVCRAVSYAHARGVVHQDLKPGNILLGEFGEVLVLDWGSASRIEDGERERRLSGTPLYMSPEQARREYADQRSDIYCLGATLFHALTLRPPTWADDADAFWDKKRRGIIDPFTQEEARTVPAALASIAMTAMSPDPAARYAAADALAADLERFQAGLAVSVHRESLWVVLRRWYRGNRRLFWLTAVGATAIAALILVIAHERSLRSARWEPVEGIGFAAPLAEQWRVRTREWTERTMHDATADDPVHIRRDGDALVLSGDAPMDLSRREPLPGGLRVQWEYTPTSKPWDLNCFIEGDSRDTGYAFHVAAFNDPTGVTLTRGVDLLVLERAHLAEPLVVGRAYAFTMEKDNASIRLSIDGRRLIDYEDLDPEAPNAGTFGFDTCANSVNRVAGLRIWHLPLAQRITPVAYARNLLQLGHDDLAYAQFADIFATYRDTALAPEALYGMAVSRARQRRMAEAESLFQRFQDGYPKHYLLPYCLRERITIALERSDAAALERTIVALQPFRGLPLVKSVATELAAAEFTGLGAKSTAAVDEERYPMDVIDRITTSVERIRRWMTVLGVDLDQSSYPEKVAGLLKTLGRDDLVLALFPDTPLLCENALNRMGRFDEVLAKDGSQSRQRGEALLGSGQYDAVIAGSFPENLRREAAFAAGGPVHAQQIFPHDPLVLLNLGRFDEALAAARGDAQAEAMVLQRQRHLEAALAKTRVDWMRSTLLVGLKRYDEAEPLLAADPSGHYMLARQLIFGEDPRGRDLLRRLVRRRQPPIGIPQVAFPHFFLLPMLDNRDGTAVDPELVWHDLLQDHRWLEGQWPWYVAAYLCGRVDEQGFRAQPYRMGLERRLHLARGLRSELSHRWSNAADEYRAAVAIPYDGTDQPGLDYMGWRLSELECLDPVPAAP